jgi:hypothetical protein
VDPVCIHSFPRAGDPASAVGRRGSDLDAAPTLALVSATPEPTSATIVVTATFSRTAPRRTLHRFVTRNSPRGRRRIILGTDGSRRTVEAMYPHVTQFEVLTQEAERQARFRRELELLRPPPRPRARHRFVCTLRAAAARL